jgi:hypothetical protein
VKTNKVFGWTLLLLVLLVGCSTDMTMYSPEAGAASVVLKTCPAWDDLPALHDGFVSTRCLMVLHEAQAKCQCEMALKAQKEAERSCRDAKRDQQELRFWKRCGVVKDSRHDPENDQWQECEGHEGAVDLSCNPLHGRPDKDMCSPSEKAFFERMKRDGVKWIYCKEGEVCEQ